MNTDAVMCMVLTSAKPSRTTLLQRGLDLQGNVEKRPALGVSNQSSLRYDFTVFLLNAQL
jgi:hypothetical protein